MAWGTARVHEGCVELCRSYHAQRCTATPHANWRSLVRCTEHLQCASLSEDAEKHCESRLLQHPPPHS
eukprot:6186512-Pleurochrysis_carterae.AAC.8